MVVDDTSVSRALITDALDQMGVQHVAIAKDGAQALQALMTQPVHLVISDMNMPGLDGLGLLKALAREQADGAHRLHPRDRQRRQDADRTRASSSGSTTYVTKPSPSPSCAARSKRWSGSCHEPRACAPSDESTSSRANTTSPTTRRRVLTTVLGSCVAACMRDPRAGVGGMNHFLLPGEDGRPVDHEARALRRLPDGAAGQRPDAARRAAATGWRPSCSAARG